MNKYTETFGVDISKDVFDCYGSLQSHLQFENTEKGFVKFLKTLEGNTLVVM
jgi:transposase